MTEPDRLPGVFLGEDGKEHRYPIGSEDAEQAAWIGAELGGTIKYNYTTKQWHRWNGIIWAPDAVRDVEEDVLRLARQRAGAIANSQRMSNEQIKYALKVVRRLFDVGRINSALDALSLMTEYKTDGLKWDQNPYLLGCENGIIDLRTGVLDQHPDPDCLVSKSTHIVYDPDATCPTFASFLLDITSGDRDLADFFIRWFGYSLFGSTDEQKFLILTGLGRNGKGALTRLMSLAFGDYAPKNLSPGIYMRTKLGATPSNNAREDLMPLKGARLAVMSEPEGGRFNEELLKMHSGGDAVVARPLYGKQMEWKPTHTITFLTNIPPSVDDIGPAMANRVLVADFKERYEGDAVDLTLEDRLAEEVQGVLRWLVVGAQVWWQTRQVGKPMAIPDRVRAQVQKYLNQNDPIGTALEEAFVIDPAAREPSKSLFNTYLDWHRDSVDPNDPLTQTAFSMLLARRGFGRKKTMTQNVILGIRSKNAMEMAVDVAD